MSRPLPPSGRREMVPLRLAPAELAEVEAALLPGEKLAPGVRRILLAAVRNEAGPATSR